MVVGVEELIDLWVPRTNPPWVFNEFLGGEGKPG
jgi:hypothetical protein